MSKRLQARSHFSSESMKRCGAVTWDVDQYDRNKWCVRRKADQPPDDEPNLSKGRAWLKAPNSAELEAAEPNLQSPERREIQAAVRSSKAAAIDVKSDEERP
jgi:hypothetical protein